jgi:lipopolysaccharide transport system permease protein
MSSGAERAFEIVPGVRRRWLAELWSARDLVGFLAWRDLVLRYRQTAVGSAWAVLRPTLTAAVLTVVFARVAGLHAGGAPYLAIVLAALIPWQLVSGALSEGGASLVAYPALVTKVYLPRMAIPLAAIAVVLVDCAVTLLLLALAMVWYREAPPLRVLLAPALLTPALAAAIGAALWASALNARYRDLRHAVPFLVQIGLYASPVGYVAAAVPHGWRWMIAVNPVAGSIDGLRWSLFAGSPAPLWSEYAISSGVAFGLLLSGIAYFRSAERSFADVI